MRVQMAFASEYMQCPVCGKVISPQEAVYVMHDKSVVCSTCADYILQPRSIVTQRGEVKCYQ